MKVVSALSYQCFDVTNCSCSYTEGNSVIATYLIQALGRCDMYKGGCDVTSGKRCLYYIRCTLLVVYDPGVANSNSCVHNSYARMQDPVCVCVYVY